MFEVESDVKALRTAMRHSKDTIIIKIVTGRLTQRVWDFSVFLFVTDDRTDAVVGVMKRRVAIVRLIDEAHLFGLCGGTRGRGRFRVLSGGF